jgi:hypothetical protein
MTASVEDIVDRFRMETDFLVKARLAKMLQTEKGKRVNESAKILGLKPAYLCHILRLLRLPDIVIDGYYSKSIAASHLFIISRLATQDEMIAAYEKILSDNLSVNQTEYLVREMLYQIKSGGKYLTKAQHEKVLAKMKDLGLEINIFQSRIRAKLTIDIKGGLDKTSPLLKKILASLEKTFDQSS